MKSLALRLAVALVTFAAGVFLTSLALERPAPRAVVTEVKTGAVALPTRECGSVIRLDEMPEAVAARLAEEFVARNGYTDLPADRENLSYESIERAADVEEMLRWRQGSLERKAYGIVYPGKWGKSGWTVVFRHGRQFGNEHDEWGRAVTMDRNFENLRVEHKSFPLGNVDKKF